MRKILFRGKLKYSDDWVYGDLFHLEGDCTQIFARDDPHAWRNDVVDPNTVGQFTGLLDKYGTKIFEGDIIESHYDDLYPDNATFEAVVFRGGAWRLAQSGHSDSDPLCEDDFYDYGIVVGNIHDNPELLKGGAE